MTIHSSRCSSIPAQLIFGLMAGGWLTASGPARAGPVVDAGTGTTAPSADADTDGRHGPFGLLDGRSVYGQFWFVEPLRAPEMDVDREFRVDYFHGENRDTQADAAKAELEYNIGLLTLELGGGYERGSESSRDPLTGFIGHDGKEGFGAVELSARHPLFQYVSADETIDYTLVGAFEVALPSGSDVSRDTELVPQVFQLLRLGDHLSVEASVGLSFLVGPDAGGDRALEYDLVLGYNIEEEDLKLPGVARVVPIFELNGERVIGGSDAGTNLLFGTAGVRLNFDPVGVVQPRIGLGYVFPIDQGARDELDWGVVTSLVFEF